MTSRTFHQDIVPAQQPVVMRGLTAEWPLVKAGMQSAQSLATYIRRFDRGGELPAMLAPPSANGRFFYNADLSDFNFQATATRLGPALDFILAQSSDDPAPAFAVQSAPVRSALPGFEAENALPLLSPAVEPRIWIGNKAIVAAHHDQSENIACVGAGRRRFTLFPPDQVAGLYPGPFERTPAGAIISMVDFDAPDLARFPRFGEAMAHAQVAELAPGDAIYIPYMWWHHVASLDRLNLLVNYWWSPPNQERGEARDAFLHALLALRALSPEHRQAWRALFDHFVFEDDGPAGAHLPPARLGILGRLDPELLRELKASLARAVSRS